MKITLGLRRRKMLQKQQGFDYSVSQKNGPLLHFQLIPNLIQYQKPYRI